MKNLQISRRNFLRSSFVLTALPAGVWAANSNENANSVVLRCAVMSDVHFKNDQNCAERHRLEKTLKFMKTFAANEPHPHFDALVIAGDMTDHGFTKELTNFRDSLFENLPEKTQALLCMGNHEFYGRDDHKKAGGAKKHWETILARPANSHSVINGFHFIGISPDNGTCRNGDYQNSLEWLERELENAAKDDPQRPVFVFQHYHISETVYGSCGIDHWGINDLRPILDKFPQVVNFSGHSHYPSNDPRSIWQGNFTALNTSTLSYYEMTGGIYEKFPEGYRNAAQVYFMEVFSDNSILFRIFDALTGTFFNIEYLLAEPGNIEKYLFTAPNRESSPSPAWDEHENAKISINEITPYSAYLTFPQAKENLHTRHSGIRFNSPKPNLIGSYQILLSQKKNGSNEDWEKAGEKNPWSEYYFQNQPDQKSISLEELEPGYDWQVEIRARNVFGKLSEKALTAVFQTPNDPDAQAQDRNHPFPKADALNFFIDENGTPQNDPFIRSFSREMETFGKPLIRYGWAEMNGKNDRFRIRFTPKDYARLKRQMTMCARFSFETFREKGAEDIMANTESGGFAFELNHSKKSLEFWCHVAGHYVIISSPITPGEHTVCGTYDGKKVSLFIDGELAAEHSASGHLTFTANPSARAFCLGSDIANGGNGSNYFTGKIKFAQLFTWALNHEQIKNLAK